MLTAPRARRQAVPKVQKDFANANLRCAQLILSMPWLYPAESFSACWARLLMRRLENQRRLTRPRAMAS